MYFYKLYRTSEYVVVAHNDNISIISLPEHWDITADTISQRDERPSETPKPKLVVTIPDLPANPVGGQMGWSGGIYYA